MNWNEFIVLAFFILAFAISTAVAWCSRRNWKKSVVEIQRLEGKLSREESTQRFRDGEMTTQKNGLAWQ